MNGRVRRNKANFSARGSIVIMNTMTLNHFVPVVKRNEDLYAFVVTKDCVIEKLIINVAGLQNMDSFSLERYVQHKAELVKKIYEIKRGLNPFDDGQTKLVVGDVVRLDIVNIDSVYENVNNVTIGILLSNKVSV